MFLRLERIVSLLSLTILLLVAHVSSDKLNERRILLPYNSGVASNFTLEALSSTSCYKWSSSRPEIVSIHVVGDPSCSTKAIVTVTSHVPKRQNSVVTARDVKTNLQIRCDVEVDVISRIAITTTTREIVLGELPEMVKVLAYNEKDDVFTSIGGIQMDWLVQPSDILRYRFWSSSSYSAPDFVTYWEQLGSKSSFVLLDGIQTGTAMVEARIVDSSYAKVEPSRVNFNVVANLILSPSNDLFIVRGTKVVFKAEIAKQASKSILKLPMAQYFAEVLDGQVAEFEEESMVLTALEEGTTSLLLRDRNPNGEILSKTSTEIHVMAPSYIAIKLGSENSPFLKNGFVYEVSLTLHDSFHHNLFISDNLRLGAIFPEQFFEVLDKSLNGTYYVVKTKMIGNCQIKGQFFGTEELMFDENEEALAVLQDVAIYNELEISPTSLYLPWIENNRMNYTLKFEARGATGEYQWEMVNGDERVASLAFAKDKSNIAALFHRGTRGRLDLLCIDPLASSTFNALAKIYLEPVEDIEVLPAMYEAEVGNNVVIPIALHGTVDGKKVSFDVCQQLDFQIDIVEKDVVSFSPDAFAAFEKPACRSFSFQCLANGNTKVWLNLAGIQTSFMIGCYMPLKVLHPVESAYLTLGASIDVAFKGGPRPWALSPEGHYRSTDSTEKIFGLEEIKNRYRFNKDLYVFRVSCENYGQSEFQLTIGNSASDKLPVPAVSSAKINIVCSQPASMTLRPKLKPTCPISKSAFPVQKGEDVQIEVTVMDENNKVFYNFSTMSFKWIKTGDGQFDEKVELDEDVDDQKGYAVLRRTYKLLKGVESKSHVIKAKSFGYRDLNSRDSFQLDAQVEIALTQVPHSIEDPITILKQSDNKKYLQIHGGSGHFTAEEGFNRDNVQIEMDSNQKHLMIIPKRVSTDSLNIIDLCLDYPPLSLSYSVVIADQIQVTLIDKIELGQEVLGTFVLLDNRGEKIDSSLHSYFKFSVETFGGFLEVTAIRPHDKYSSAFRVKALEVGNTKLIVKSNLDALQQLKSAHSKVQVFPPLTIYPSNITMILGNRFQVSLFGGPETSRNLKFSIIDTSVAHVEQNGLITGKALGKTTLNVKILNVNNFVYSESKVDIFVVPLTKIKIFSPVNSILVGSNVPLHLLGANFEHETPMMFGNAIPALKIDWSISNENVAVLESPFQHMGIIDRSVDKIATRFVARSPGTVLINVRVEAQIVGQIAGNIVLEDSVQLDVYPKFSPIFSGNDHDSSPPSKALLLSPNSLLKLHSDPTDDVTYQLLNGSQVILMNDSTMALLTGNLPEYAQLVVHRNVHRSGVHEYYNYAIHVDKVHYLELRFSDSRPTSEHMIDSFPVGSELEFQVGFFDNHGRKFDAVRSGLKTYLSNNDVVAIVKGKVDDSFIIRSVREGSVILHIYDEVNSIGTYYKITVGSILESFSGEAIDGLEIGDVVCFKSKLKIDENVASWSLLGEDGTVPGVLSDNGVFVALSSGKANLVYKTEVDGFRSHNSVTVNRIGQIVFDGPLPTTITTTSTLFIPIKNVNTKIVNNINEEAKRTVRNTCSTSESIADVASFMASLSGQKILPFICSSQFKNNALTSLWTSKAVFDHALNQWACVFTARSDVDLSSFESLSLNNLEVVVSVMANAANLDERDLFESDAMEIHSLELPFLPPFQVSTKRILFTPEKSVNYFTITSAPAVLNELRISSSNMDLIEVEKVETINSTLKVLAILKNANIFSDDVSNLHFLLRSELTNQTVRIPVQIRLLGTLEELTNKFHPYVVQKFYTIFSTLLAVAGVLAFFYFKRNPELQYQPQTDRGGFFDTPDSKRASNIPRMSPGSPESSSFQSGSGVGNASMNRLFSSPRTPQQASSTPRPITKPRLYSYTPMN